MQAMVAIIQYAFICCASSSFSSSSSSSCYSAAKTTGTHTFPVLFQCPLPSATARKRRRKLPVRLFGDWCGIEKKPSKCASADGIFLHFRHRRTAGHHQNNTRCRSNHRPEATGSIHLPNRRVGGGLWCLCICHHHQHNH